MHTHFPVIASHKLKFVGFLKLFKKLSGNFRSGENFNLGLCTLNTGIVTGSGNPILFRGLSQDHPTIASDKQVLSLLFKIPETRMQVPDLNALAM